MKQPNFIGLTFEDAVKLCDKLSITYRIASKDGEARPLTMEVNLNRVNFTISANTVVDVTNG